MTILNRTIDRIGDWNPQLFRELKGRLTLQNVIITLVVSAMGQYFIYSATKLSFFKIIDYIIPPLLMVLGTYLISQDLAKEYTNRTLEFIRLTPQSSQAILRGKLLGVPILIYLGVLLIIPFHFVGSFWLRKLDGYEHLSALSTLTSYLFLIAQIWLCYTGGMLYTLHLLSLNQKHKNQMYSPAMIAGSVALLSYFLTFINGINIFHLFNKTSISWYKLPLEHSLSLTFLWLSLIYIILGYFCWISTNRYLQNPQTTLLSKTQSYQLTLFFNLLILGFSGLSHIFVGFLLFLFTPLISLILLASLCPRRQFLLDWARYRHLNRKEGVWLDLIWGDKSPPLVAIAINVFIPFTLWLTWLMLSPETRFMDGELAVTKNLIGVLFICFVALSILSTTLIYTTLVQMITLTKDKLLTIGATLTLITLIALPLMLGLLWGFQRVYLPSVWLFTPLPILAFYKGSILTTLSGFTLQLGILFLLLKQLQKQFKVAGAAETENVMPILNLNQ